MPQVILCDADNTRDYKPTLQICLVRLYEDFPAKLSKTRCHWRPIFERMGLDYRDKNESDNMCPVENQNSPSSRMHNNNREGMVANVKWKNHIMFWDSNDHSTKTSVAG